MHKVLYIPFAFCVYHRLFSYRYASKPFVPILCFIMRLSLRNPGHYFHIRSSFLYSRVFSLQAKRRIESFKQLSLVPSRGRLGERPTTGWRAPGNAALSPGPAQAVSQPKLPPSSSVLQQSVEPWSTPGPQHLTGWRHTGWRRRFARPPAHRASCHPPWTPHLLPRSAPTTGTRRLRSPGCHARPHPLATLPRSISMWAESSIRHHLRP